MKVKVTSHIVDKTDVSGEYHLPDNMNIVAFMEQLQIKWDYEALVVINGEIIDEHYFLQDGDNIFLLTPIYGG